MVDSGQSHAVCHRSGCLTAPPGGGSRGTGNALQAQPQLRAGRSRGTEQGCIQWVARRAVQVQPPAGDAETVPQQDGERPGAAHARAETRSEEHTSELQSQSNLVCRLLLEKKKKNHPSSKLEES